MCMTLAAANDRMAVAATDTRVALPTGEDGGVTYLDPGGKLTPVPGGWAVARGLCSPPTHPGLHRDAVELLSDFPAPLSMEALLAAQRYLSHADTREYLDLHIALAHELGPLAVCISSRTQSAVTRDDVQLGFPGDPEEGDRWEALVRDEIGDMAAYQAPDGLLRAVARSFAKVSREHPTISGTLDLGLVLSDSGQEPAFYRLLAPAHEVADYGPSELRDALQEGPWTPGSYLGEELDWLETAVRLSEGESLEMSGGDLPRLPGQDTLDRYTQRLTESGQGKTDFGREDTGGTARKMPKNPQRESNLRDGDGISYSSDGVPDWNPRGHGMSYRPDDGSWDPDSFDPNLPQAQRFQLEGVTASSATVRAQLQQIGATTDRTDDFPGSNFGETDTSDSDALDNIPAVNDEFEVGVFYHFETEAAQDIDDKSGSWEATLEIYGVDGATGQETLRVTDTWTGFAGFNQTIENYRWNTGTFPELQDATSDFIRIEFADLRRTSGDIVFRSFPDTYMDGVNEAQSRDDEHGIKWQTASNVIAPMTDDDVQVAFNILDPS